MKKVKLLVISDAVAPTGFARVSHSIFKFFDLEKYDIHWLGINYSGDPHPYPYKIYPARAGGSPKQQDVLGIKRTQELLEVVDPDIIFILGDSWVQTNYLGEIKVFYSGKKLPKIVNYTPVDASEHDSEWYRHYDIVVPVAYTEYGKKVIQEAAPNLNVRVIPHGVDSEVFYKIDKPKNEIKKEMFPEVKNLHEDTFIILNANRNQTRKRIEIAMEAFALFSQNKPENVKFYAHCGVQDQAIDVLKFANRLGIDRRLILTNMQNGSQSVPSELLNKIYNICDVGTNTSLGEGWGLPNMEHASIGAPQVLPDHSAMHELYQDCGILVEPTLHYILDMIMTKGGLVAPEDMAMGYEALYRDEELYSLLSERSRTKFSSPYYSWKNISKQWQDLFDEVLNVDSLSF